MEVRPLRLLLMRASDSDAYKPLPLYGAAQDPIGYLTPISDPQMGGQQYAVAETLVSGGIPSGLQPETSATRSLGLVYAPDNGLGLRTIGRASCRDRGCQYVLISVVAVSLTKKTKK